MLDLDRELVEKFGITPALEPDNEQKLEYVQEQINQIKLMAWRNRVDYMVMSAANPKNDEEKDQQAAKLKEFERDLSKLVEALTSFNKIASELVNA